MIDICVGFAGSPPWTDSFDNLVVPISDNLELTYGIEKDKMKVADIAASSDSRVDFYTWIDLYDDLAVASSDNLELMYGIENEKDKMKVAGITALSDFSDLRIGFLHLDWFI